MRERPCRPCAAVMKSQAVLPQLDKSLEFGAPRIGPPVFVAMVRLRVNSVASAERRRLPVFPGQRTFFKFFGMSQRCHVWTAPCWQELFSRFAALVGAAMCSAFSCGSHDRWP
jgi:hypothetical protein